MKVNIAKMNTFRFDLVFSVLVLLFVFGCSQSIPESQHHSSIFEKINKLEVDSMRKVSMFYRDMHTMVMRCYINDTCGYIQLISKKTDNDILKVKYKDRWINIDSIEYYYPLNTVGISKDKIIYNFEMMDELYLDEISTTCDYDVLFLKKDSLDFIYVYDTTYFDKHKIIDELKRLDGNWWVEK